MRPVVMAPTSSELCWVFAERQQGPPSLTIQGLAADRARTTLDRVRAGIANSGFTIPTGGLEVEVHCSNGRQPEGLDFAIALVIMLADPTHRSIRRRSFVANGTVSLDGTLHGCGTPLIGDLPDGPWVGRFWHPPDRVPSVEEDAVVSIFDVKNLAEGWDVYLRLIEMERSLECDQLPRTTT